MKNLRKKTMFSLSLIALTLVLTISSCAKHQVKKDIKGTWTVQEILVDGEIFFHPSPESSILWTFNNKRMISESISESIYTSSTSKTGEPYRIRNRGKTLSLFTKEWSIIELTSTQLVLQSESNGEVRINTFSR